jgi:hypothetical protein
MSLEQIVIKENMQYIQYDGLILDNIQRKFLDKGIPFTKEECLKLESYYETSPRRFYEMVSEELEELQ